MFYKDSIKEKGNYSLSASFVSTVLISINLMTIYFLFEYLNMFPFTLSKSYIVVFMILIWIFNYYGIVRKEEFLECDFGKDKKGGVLVIIFIIATALFFILIANLNREKILNQKTDKNISLTVFSATAGSFDCNTLTQVQ